jgi:hypothetical protein
MFINGYDGWSFPMLGKLHPIVAGGNFRALVRKATPPGQHIRLVPAFCTFPGRHEKSPQDAEASFNRHL